MNIGSEQVSGAIIANPRAGVTEEVVINNVLLSVLDINTKKLLVLREKDFDSN